MRVSSPAKEGMDWLKQTYNFKTYSDCIVSIQHFFKKNNLSPTESFGNKYSESLIDFKQEIILKLSELLEKATSNTECIIKEGRDIKEELIKPMSHNISDMYKQTITTNLELDNAKERINVLDKNLSEQNILIRKLNNIIKQQAEKIEEYHRCMSILNSNITIEKTLTSKKAVITLPTEEVSQLFHLLF